MHEFLLAERELRRRFAELEKEMWARFAAPDLHPVDLEKIQKMYDEYTMVETFNDAGDKATVITTTVRPSQHLTRARYTLERIDGKLRIKRLEWKCQVCEANGNITLSDGKVRECMVCHGVGWFVAPPPKKE